ncbi:Superkiller protein 3 [Xanthoria calcicola]
MSAVKSALRAAKAALDAHQYGSAIENANKALKEDPKNYHANVFLGLAFEKQNQHEDAEKSYRAATLLKGSDPLAWQGLISLYEQQGGQKLDEYHDATSHLASVFIAVDDKTRCQTVVDKYTDFARKCGTRAQYRHSLELLLPGSDLYDYLEGRILHPAYTYTKIAELLELDEKEKINYEIGQRRTRLGAKIDQVTADVKREVLQASDLETIYQCIVDWTEDDATRRLYEERILQRAYDTLVVIPPALKPQKREQVLRLAQGLVILKHPFNLAWRLSLEWKDVDRIEDLDAGLLREYVRFFAEDGLAKVLRGYLDSEISAFPTHTPEDSDDDDDDARGKKSVAMTAEDRLILMTDGIEDSPASVLALRIMAEYYLYLEEYESAVVTARKAQHELAISSQASGLSFTNMLDAVSISLGTAMIHYQAPRHHPEATSLFEGILARRKSNSAALIGIGLILEERGELEDAISFLERALQQAPSTRVKAEAAWCKALSGDYETGVTELEECLSQLDTAESGTKTLKAQILYRIGMCLWNLDTSKSSRKDRNRAYARFISSLQADMNYAPAYTSLGIYYTDYARDKARARKCFQKAFELSSSEIVAAERLAQSFAKTKEWDLVEVVAQRVVESGRLRPPPGSKKQGISWPFAALGVVQLNIQDYSKSVVSFQSALRISPKDYYSWVGLGESYHNSGRYIAATRAFEQAQKLEAELGPEVLGDTWFSKYMLANVERELGEFGAAIAGYKEVLALRKREYGVSIASLQTLIEAAWQDIELGFFGRAIDNVQEALKTAEDLVTWRKEAFNLWKSIGDLCSVYTYLQSYSAQFPFQSLVGLLKHDFDLEAYGLLADVDHLDWAAFASSAASDNPDAFLGPCCHAAILAQKRAISCCVDDAHARAVAWYNLGWTEHRAHVCLIADGNRDNPLSYLKSSIQCFKRAIELESGNSEFWNSLGIVTSQLNPKVAQHAFVRSLFINDKNARTWTNLGVFYLVESDTQLASDAFTRAQSIDPEHALAWLGQGLLAAQLGESSEARNLFAHGFEIASASATQIQRSYACSVLDHLLASPGIPSSATDLLRPALALRQLSKQSLADLPFEHIDALVRERMGNHAEASEKLSTICSTLEAEYETSESVETLARFANAKADLSRSLLAEGNFESAAENAETALDLSVDDDSSNMRKRTRLSAQISGGLSHHHLGLFDRSTEAFKGALEESQENPDIVCLLSQVLWAKGGEAERNIASQQLFNCIEKHPSHAHTMLLLGTISVLHDDQDTIQAVSDDLRGLRTRDDLTHQQQKQLAQLLSAIAILYPEEKGQTLARTSEVTTAVMLGPSHPYGWSQLSGITDEPGPPEMAILTAIREAPPRGALTAEDLSEVYAQSHRGEDAQRSIVFAPWKPSGWHALSQLS